MTANAGQVRCFAAAAVTRQPGVSRNARAARSRRHAGLAGSRALRNVITARTRRWSSSACCRFSLMRMLLMCFSTVPSWYPARPRSSDTPVFETGDPRYSWINEVQAVGKGVLSADKTRLDYEICELR